MNAAVNLLAAAPARWPRDAQAAVALMVDDLTDGWIDHDRSGRPTGANDWGHALDGPGSSFAFFRDGLLREHPEIRTTFFVPVDRVEDVRPAHHPAHFRRIDERPELVDFLRRVHADARFECAYHGLEHGRPGRAAPDYVPEFATYETVDAAMAGLEAGRAVWRGVFGEDPAGGKYPAYTSGPHGDAAIDAAGFLWWCRRFDGAAPTEDPLALSPRFFGERGVLDLPSTVHGGLLTQPRPQTLSMRSVAARAVLGVRARLRLRTLLTSLLARRGVITVQEHITWTRPDDTRQTPNLRDDVPTLRAIFSALRGHDVWHATCGDIARYVEARERTLLRALPGGRLLVEYPGRQAAPAVALALLAPGLDARSLTVAGPDGARTTAAVATRRGDTLITEPIRLHDGVWRVTESD